MGAAQTSRSQPDVVVVFKDKRVRSSRTAKWAIKTIKADQNKLVLKHSTQAALKRNANARRERTFKLVNRLFDANSSSPRSSGLA
mmetsp:Transcript_60437/g.129618  ORF Transcript_60437/g.129618 Transcript_60437/m.129618 type:complete len:85 (+) Transcript_60437:493-747(+)